MDFEVLSDNPRSLSLWEEFEKLLSNKKAALKNWARVPPHRLGWTIFFLVVFELTLGSRMLRQRGLDLSIFGQFTAYAVMLLLIAMTLAVIAAQAAEIFKAHGQTTHLITFFNLGLAPLLLLLPVTLISWTSQAGAGVRLFLIILLIMKVVGNWRDALELTYKFTKMQSAIVLYAASSVGFVLLLLAGYALLFSKLASFLI